MRADHDRDSEPGALGHGDGVSGRVEEVEAGWVVADVLDGGSGQAADAIDR